MKTHFLFSLLTFALFVSGCATRPIDTLVARPVDPYATRRQAYERILKNVEPGMTRRQLYAMLPPKSKPEVMPSHFNICGLIFYTWHRERYLLDRDFYLEVSFRLANPNDYIFPEDTRFAEYNRYSKCLMERLGTQKGDQPRLTCAELVYRLRLQSKHPQLPRSKENLNDEIVSPWVSLCGPGRWESFPSIPLSLGDDLFIQKPTLEYWKKHSHHINFSAILPQLPSHTAAPSN